MSGYQREYQEMGGSTIAYLDIPDGYDAPPRIEFPFYEVSGALGRRAFIRVDPGVEDDDEFEARCRAISAASRVGNYEAWDDLIANLQRDVLDAIGREVWGPAESAKKAAEMTELYKDRPVREDHKEDADV